MRWAPSSWLTILAAAGASAPPSAAQHPVLTHGKPTSPIPRGQPLRPPPYRSIPFRLRDNLVVVDVKINGRSQPAVLDSGAGALIVGRGLAKTLGLRHGRADGEVAGAGPQAQQLIPTTISELRVGPLKFGDVPAQVVDLGQLSSSAGFPVELLIGAPAFKSGFVRIDYRRRLVTFGPSGGGAPCAAPIPLSVVHDVPVVEAELRSKREAAPVRLRLVVDIGNRHRALMIGGGFIRSQAGRDFASSGTAQQVGHGTGGGVQGSLARAAELRLAGIVLQDVEVALTPGVAAFEESGLDGAIGVPVWQSGAITFDYAAGRLCIER